ncbi:hypothetical protein CS8_007830 [Cupriavidus sp. 8B]
MPAVGPEHPQVIAPRIGTRVPIAGEALAGFDEIAARHTVQVQPVVDVEHCPGLAAVGKAEVHCPMAGIDQGLCL